MDEITDSPMPLHKHSACPGLRPWPPLRTFHCRGVIYLDHNATTPVLPEVRDAMLPFFGEDWGNPSSSYRFGSRLKSVVESARESVADLLGAASPREILFTGSGTESNNTALHAAVLAQPEALGA